ncbi:MAG: glycosyltransferase [Peptoclostridium sp.]|uniref:glycosyltransferase n=1 Tax=Peptoclostridium sp. TaxID=1904860 RepID=UPI00139E2030|nr:glycosyltransferase [Peptoclostridium sp.]MZQ75528.1 glycosyltransferase [Peptoclostridium sp.]
MNILFITIYFPPMNNSASIRSLYYVNYLRKLGHNVGVVTCRYNEDHIYHDSALNERIDGDVRIYRESAGYVYSKTYAKKGESGDGGRGGASGTARIKGVLKKYMAVPDSFVFWQKNAIKKAEELIGAGEYDMVFSMHELPSSHMVAYSIKKRMPGIRWVAYWSDPWTVQSSERNDQPLLRKLYERGVEKNVVMEADICLFTSEQTRNMYVDTFGLEPDKTGIVYRGYDGAYYDKIRGLGAPEGILPDRINIVHTGAIYTQLRDVDPFIDAIRTIKSSSPELYERLNIVLLGEIDNIKNIQSFEDLDIISIRKRAPFEEALRYMIFSNVNILWGNKASSQIPGKVYEYMGTDSCILTILGDELDPLLDIMSEANRGPVVRNDSKEIYRAVMDIASRMDTGTMPGGWSNRNEKYRWENVVADLAEKIAVKA